MSSTCPTEKFLEFGPKNGFLFIARVIGVLRRRRDRKCPSTRPVSAPINASGIPPINFARSSTDCSYQDAWL
jgi:hypothetical protein